MEHLLKKIKNDYLTLIGALIAMLIVFKIIYYSESFFTIIKLAFVLWFLYVIPGYLISLLLSEEIYFIERLLVGVVICLGLTGVLSYLLNFVYINIKYHTYIIFILICITAILLHTKKMKK